MIRYNGIEIDRETRTVRHRSRTWIALRKTSVTFDLVCALICGGGLSTAQLFSIAYGGDPNGGPITGPQTIDVWIVRKRSIFKELDLELRCVKTAGVRFLSLEPMHRF